MPIAPTGSQNPNPAPVAQPIEPATPAPVPSPEPAPAPALPPVVSISEPTPEKPQNLFPLSNYEDVRIRAARATQFGKTPEMAARIFNAEQKTGLPTPFIEENIDEVEKNADIQGFSAAEFARRSPKFASWIAANPNNYALSKDDLDNGKGLESSVKTYSLMQSAHDSLYKGFADFNASLAKLPAFAYDVAALPQNLVAKIPGLEGLQTRAPEEWYNNAVTKYFEEKSKISYENNPDLQADILELVAHKKYEEAGRALFANVVTNAPNALALMLGAGAGKAAQSLAFAAATTGANAAGSPENQAADPVTSTLNASVKGGFEAAFEEMGTLSVLKKWSNGLMNKVGRTSAAEVVLNFSKMMVSSFLQEGSEEAATEYAQDLTDYLMGVNPDALDGIHGKALTAGLIGGFSGTTLTAPTGLGMGLVHAKANKQTQIQKDVYTAIGTSAEASKVRERLPLKYREMVDKITKDGPVENVYIPVDKFTELFQSYENGGLPGAVNDLEVEKEFQDAKESGGLVKIKTSIWAEKIAGTDQFNRAAGDITFDPSQFTENESKEAAKALSEDATTFDPSQFDGEKAIDGMPVVQQVEKMLIDTGMSPENARKNAVVYRFFDILARRSGKSAEQIFSEYNLKVMRSVPNAQVNNFTPDQAVPAPKTLDLNPIINQIRAGKIPKDQKVYGKSLLKFIREKGGIKENADVSTLEKGIKGKKLVNKDAKLNIDQMAESALDSGYITSKEPNELIDAIAKEISGNPVYSAENKNDSLEVEKIALEDLLSRIERLGIDIQTAKNEEIISKLVESGTPTEDEANVYLQTKELFQMAGRKSKTANSSELAKAFAMSESGEDMDKIRKETGWFMGQDKRWRYEISDRDAKFKDVNLNKRKSYTLGEILDHESLFKAYPELRDVKVLFKAFRGRNLGTWNRENNTIEIKIDKIINPNNKIVEELRAIRESKEYKEFDEKHFNASYEDAKKILEEFKKTEMGERYTQVSRASKLFSGDKVFPAKIPDDALNTVLHEIQHAIQHTEGFAPGANRRGDGKLAYERSHGEVEARDTEARKNLTAEELKNKTPSTLTTKYPYIKWDKVTAELPIDSIPDQMLEKFSIGGQMTLFQSKAEQIKRGRILFDQNGNFNIEFLKGADATTFLHESAHFFLEVYGDQASKADAPEGIKEDYAKILKYLGVESKDQITEKEHEKFAEAFENYLLEGKVPVSSLRETFNDIKAWFIGIYKSIVAAYPNVKLSEDIRGVFDRMLATEEEIMLAQNEIGATPLIPNTDGVMSKEDAEKYIRLITLEREQAADLARAKAMESLTREMTKMRKEREKEIRAEVTAFVENEPNQIILNIIRNGEAPNGYPLPKNADKMRLNKKIVAGLYDPKVVQALPRGIYDPEGQHPNVVAGLLMGANATGADLLTLLANTPEKKARIEQLTQERMNQEFPDPIVDGTIAQEAMKAVHNDFGAERRNFEIDQMMKNRPAAVKGMTKAFTARKITIAQFRKRAEIIIGTTAVRDIRPIVYQRGELKHAKEAVRLFLKGDFDGAIEAKQKEILNHELYRVAIKAKEEVQKAQDNFNKVFRKDEKLAKTRDMAYVNAARAVLAKFQIGAEDKTAEDYLSGLQKYDPDLYTQIMEIVDHATAHAGNHRDVSFNVFMDMANTFNQLWLLSKAAHQITIDGKKMSRFTAQEEMKVILQEHLSKRGGGEEFARATNEYDERKMNFGSVKSAFKRVEFWVDLMDNGRIGGPFRKYIWEPVSSGVTKYRLAKNQYMDQFLKLIQDHTQGFSEESIIADELVGLPNDAGVVSKYKFQNKAELLGAMLHIGNESNLRKLLVGNRWGSLDENGNLDTSNWDSFIQRMIREGVLKKEDYDFLQSCWDLMEQLKPEAQKAHYEIYGYHFSEITANEVKTPFGNYKGGYAPAAVDRLRVKNNKAQQKAIEEGTDANYFPAQINGFAKNRVESYAAPLSMNLRLLPMHVDQVLRFTHITPRMRDVTKMLFDKEFRAMLESYDHSIVDDFLIPWLDRTVKQSVVTPSKYKGIDQFFRNLRSKTGMATMFLNVVNTLQQYTGIVVAGLKVAPKHLRDATFNFVKNSPEMADFAYENSDFMKTKINFQMSETQKEISKILKKPSSTEKVSEFFEKNAYALQAMAQNQVDLIVWHAAYSQAQDEVQHSDPKEKKKLCIQIADSAVRMTQGTFAPEDVSRFETGTPAARLFTMFSSYFNMLANLLGTEAAKTMQQETGMKKSAMRAFYVYSVGFMIPAVMSESILLTLSGKGFDADDDGNYLDDFMALFFGSQFKTGAALVPLLGQAVTSAVNRFNSQQWDDRINISPVMTMIDSVAGVPYDIYKDIERGELSKRTVRDGLTLVSLLSNTFGIGPKLPVLPLTRPINYLQDLESGRAQPGDGVMGGVDITRGLITGKPGSK